MPCSGRLGLPWVQVNFHASNFEKGGSANQIPGRKSACPSAVLFHPAFISTSSNPAGNSKSMKPTTCRSTGVGYRRQEPRKAQFGTRENYRIGNVGESS